MTRPTYTPLTSAIGISATLPEEFEVTAWTADRDELMGFRHKEMVLEGVQFHPESFLTEECPQLIQNFLRL